MKGRRRNAIELTRKIRSKMVNMRKGVSFVLFISLIDKYAVGFRMYPLKGKSSISSSQLYTQSQTNNQIRKRNFATNRSEYFLR